MDFTQIKYFLAVAQSLNFTKAAESCAVSQPALSKAIRNLEDNLGNNLFNRNSQRVELTEFGKIMLVHFERIEDDLHRARGAADAASANQIEKLNIGVMCTIGPKRFGNFLQSFRLAHCNTEVILHNVTADVIPELLLSNALDCVFCVQTGYLDQRFEVIELLEEPMVIAFADDHQFCSSDTVSLSQIADESYLDRLHCEFRDDFLKFTKARGLNLNIALSSEREDWIYELVSQGVGVSVVPLSSAQLNSVMYRPISDLTDMRTLKLVTTKNAGASNMIAAFKNSVIAYDWAQ